MIEDIGCIHGHLKACGSNSTKELSNGVSGAWGVIDNGLLTSFGEEDAKGEEPPSSFGGHEESNSLSFTKFTSGEVQGLERIDIPGVLPYNNHANSEFNEMIVSLAKWHLGNCARRGLPSLMKAVLPATLLGGVQFRTVAERAFADG